MRPCIGNLRVSCLLLLSVDSLDEISLGLSLLQQCTHVVTILDCGFLVLCWYGSILLIYCGVIICEGIRGFLRAHFRIPVIFLLDIGSCRCSALSLGMLRLLLLIWLLLIMNYSWLIRIEALVLDLRGLLTGFVATYTVLGVELSINALSSIPARCGRNNLGLLGKHLDLLVLLLSFSALRPVIIWSVVLSNINFVGSHRLRDHLRRSGLIHGFHPLLPWNLCIRLLLAIYFVIHGLHQTIVSVYSPLHICLLDAVLALPRILLLLNDTRFLEAWMLIIDKAIAVLLVVSRIACNQCRVHIRCYCPSLSDYVIGRVSCLLYRLLQFIDLTLVKFVFKL